MQRSLTRKEKKEAVELGMTDLEFMIDTRDGWKHRALELEKLLCQIKNDGFEIPGSPKKTKGYDAMITAWITT